MWKINEMLWEVTLNILSFVGTASMLVTGLMCIGALVIGAYIWCEGEVKARLIAVS